MMRVSIDGNLSLSDTGDMKTMAELVEYIKANIDPDSIIVDMTIGGQELSDADWNAPLSLQGDSELAVRTGSKEDYISERLSSSALLVDHIVNEFIYARNSFEEGSSADGNAAFGTAVNDLKAFVGWYDAVLNMLPDELVAEVKEFHSKVHDITATCEQLHQQQLYQSWWALSETMENQLEPKLNNLKAACEKIADDWQKRN